MMPYGRGADDGEMTGGIICTLGRGVFEYCASPEVLTCGSYCRLVYFCGKMM